MLREESQKRPFPSKCVRELDTSSGWVDLEPTEGLGLSVTAKEDGCIDRSEVDAIRHNEGHHLLPGSVNRNNAQQRQVPQRRSSSTARLPDREQLQQVRWDGLLECGSEFASAVLSVGIDGPREVSGVRENLVQRRVAGLPVVRMLHLDEREGLRVPQDSEGVRVDPFPECCCSPEIGQRFVSLDQRERSEEANLAMNAQENVLEPALVRPEVVVEGQHEPRIQGWTLPGGPFPGQFAGWTLPK